MQRSSAALAFVACVGTWLGGCSSSGGNWLSSPLTTQSISTTSTTAQPAVAQASKIDPACYALAQRIETLRREGVTERLEKVSTGKSTTVAVKRASLAQAAELDKANAEFQAKCSVLGPRPAQTAVAPLTTGAVPPNSAQVVSANAPKTAGTPVAPPVVVQQP